MKPKIFIGSSVEGLPIAEAIQENLEYSAECTIWSQGVFKLSSNALDSLIKALENYDFALFVFTPDDTVQMRSSTTATVRDNIVFEFGLFIGRLGKERVFFVKPRGDDFRLPSDIIGLTHGTYNNTRDDQNLVAALGPFCSKLKTQLNEFIIENMSILNEESDKVRRIAYEKKDLWELRLAEELLRSKFEPIERQYENLSNELVFAWTERLTIHQFLAWVESAFGDLQRLIKLISNTYEYHLTTAFGLPGTPGSIEKIYEATNRMGQLCNELLNYELQLRKINVSEKCLPLKRLLHNLTKSIGADLFSIPDKFKEGISEENIAANNNSISINVTLAPLAKEEEIIRLIEHMRTDPLYYLEE